MKRILSKIKYITLRDIIGIFKFLLVLIPALMYKIYLKIVKKELWLICEQENTARDNGYIFFKYMCEKHPEIDSYYVINSKSNDYKKVAQLGKIVNWASFKHYFYYMSATKNISSHKEGNPNHLLFTLLHLYINLYNNRVFLQHGVLYQNHAMFHKKNTKFVLFITGAKPEYDFVNNEYGYSNEVKYTGLARFDNLHNIKKDNEIIILMPTWRRWLDNRDIFSESEYFKRMNSLINNIELEKVLEKENKYLYFYPHFSAQKYIDLYEIRNNRIKVLTAKNTDIQDLLKSGSLMITDYSSVFTDFSYMHKPVIYYQYDEEEFHLKHFQSGESKSYFDFSRDGFGDVVDNEEMVINKIKYYIENNFAIEKKYVDRINNFFILHDNKNCERIYQEILEVNNNE